MGQASSKPARTTLTMASEEDAKGAGQGAGCPLLEDDRLAASNNTNTESNPTLIRGGGGGLEHDEGSSTSTQATGGRRHQIPTLVWIIVPTILVFVAVFLAAVFMPHATREDETPPPANKTHNDNDNHHDNPILPTLLAVRKHDGSGGLVDVRNNELYRKLKYATFHETDSSTPEKSRRANIMNNNMIRLRSDKKEIEYGHALTLLWGNEDLLDTEDVDDEDVLALYCPAGEENPIKFRDAATIAQVRATHAYHNHDQGATPPGEWSNNKVWSIPSFPIVREESCEFRLYAQGEGSSWRNNNDHYTFLASTGHISLTSIIDPTGIHLGLTGKPSEMYIQFVTGNSGEPVVEIAKKSDIHTKKSTSNAKKGDKRHLAGTQVQVSWTKLKGTSTTYVATDMCQEPATSTEPGYFVSPGHLHTVKATNLEPDVEYVYRVGLGFGQGIKWSDKYRAFLSSPPPGRGPPAAGKPALTFLALGDQGCSDSYNRAQFSWKGATPPADGVDPAQHVTDLITGMIDERVIHSIHHVGDLSYADGAAHVWDAWFDMIQPYASQVPLMVGVGNHEYDHTDGGDTGKDPSGVLTKFGFQPNWAEGAFNNKGGECGVPVSKRFAVPDNGNDVFWYSYDQSLVHTVVLSSEHNMTLGTPQFNWLEKDLATVNRTITPWVVVEMHRPMYNSALPFKNNWSGQIVSEGMQNEIEDLLHAYQVDLVLSGHYHSYFRSCDGLYSYKCDNGGPTHITVGTAGAPMDPNTTSLAPNDYTEFYDKEHWGVGRVSVFNATVLHWEFVAIGGNVTDEIWLSRSSGRGR